MNTRTSDTKKYAQVPAGPPRALTVAVNTIFIIFLLQHRAQDGLNLLLDHFLLLLLSSRLVGHSLGLINLQWSGI